MLKPSELIEKIISLHGGDWNNTKSESRELVKWYKKLTPEQKTIADRVTIHICGYNIDSILNGKTMF